MSALEPGDKVGEYVLLSRLGEGGFGEVWRARHGLWTDRVVAVKVPRDPEYLAYLRREGLLVHELDHPNVVRALGADLDADPPYLVTELVDGTNLREVLDRRGALPCVAQGGSPGTGCGCTEEMVSDTI